MKVIYAVDQPVTKNKNHNESVADDGATLAASICQNDIEVNFRRQLDLLEQRVNEEKQKKDRTLASYQRFTFFIIGIEVLLGFILSVVFWSIYSALNTQFSNIFLRIVVILIGVVILGATGFIIIWTIWSRIKSYKALTASCDEAISNRVLIKNQFNPEGHCRVGLVWLGLQLAHQSKNEIVLLDLTQSMDNHSGSLIVGPIEPVKTPLKFSDPKDQNKDQTAKFQELLAQFEEVMAEVKSWEIIPAWLPIIFKDANAREELIKEIREILEEKPAQSAKPDLLILKSSGSLSLLEPGKSNQVDVWLKNYQNAAGWTAYFKGLGVKAQKIQESALEVFREGNETRLEKVRKSEPQVSVWANICTQRPDELALLDQLKKEQDQLEKSLNGGIDHEQRQQLLEELKSVMYESHDQPWHGQWAQDVTDLNRHTTDMINQLISVGDQFKNLTISLNNLHSRLTENNQWLGGRLGEVSTLLQQVKSGLISMQSVLSDPSNKLSQERYSNSQSGSLGGKVVNQSPTLSQLNTTKDQMANNLASSASALTDIKNSLYKLDQSVQVLTNNLTDLDRQLNLPLSEIIRIVDQLKRTLAILDDDLQQRKVAIAEYGKRIHDIENSYIHQVEDAKSKVLQSKKALEDIQKNIVWLTYQPATLVSELTGIERSSLEEMSSFPSAILEETLQMRIRNVLEQSCKPILDQCELRMKLIDSAHRLVQQALKITTSKTLEAEALLIPVWYVEWHVTIDPEEPQTDQVHYQLTLPLVVSQPEDGHPSSMPLYPVIQKYIQSVSLPDLWTGKFSPGQPPPLARTIYQSIPLQEVKVKYPTEKNAHAR